MSGDAEHDETRRLPRSRVWISIALLAGSLAVLTLSPVLVSMRTRALRFEITEVAEPTIAAVSGIERAVGLQLAALRGYALTGASTFLREYARLDDLEREHTARLRDLAGRLDPENTRHSQRLVSLAAEWDESVSSLSGVLDPQALDRLVTREAMPTSLLAEAQSLRRSVESIERLRRADIAAAERIEVWINWIMVVLATAAGVSLVVIGRRVRELGVEAEERRAKLQQSVDRRARLMRGMSTSPDSPRMSPRRRSPTRRRRTWHWRSMRPDRCVAEPIRTGSGRSCRTSSPTLFATRRQEGG